MPYQFSFERLDIWQESRKFAVEVYRLTRLFPEDEKFGLTSQLRRASVSVASNLAEGSARTSGKEQARFSEISYASLMEVMCQMSIANDLNYIQDGDLEGMRKMIQSISFKINALRISQLEG